MSVRPALLSRAALILLALVTAAPLQLLAQRPWYAAYEEGVAAVKRQDWARAEERLASALAAEPEQNRRKLFYGTRRDVYVPEFYLAVVYTNTGRVDAAQALLTKVERAGLIASASAEYKDLQRVVASARAAEEQRLARLKPPPVVPPPSKPPVEPPPRRPDDAEVAARAEAERRERFAALMKQAAGAVTAGSLDVARARLADARAIGFNDEAALENMERRIGVATAERAVQIAIDQRNWPDARRLADRLNGLDKSNPRLAAFETAIASGLAEVSAGAVRTALRAFFAGDYEGTIRQLEPLRKSGNISARVLLYLACSNAAIGLLEGDKGATRLARGRQLYGQARAGGDGFSVDRRYISPQILRALETRDQ